MLIERDVMVQYANKVLQSLDAEHEGLVFGRLDLGDTEARGEVLYIGRLGLRDENFDNLVLDWRAPASGAFYQATAEHPMGVLRRRVIRCSRERVLDIDDDVLAPGALPETSGSSATARSWRRWPGARRPDARHRGHDPEGAGRRDPGAVAGITEITGGPGTGKTAVALHRAPTCCIGTAARLTGAGVLVVGPSPVFTNYISRVLPSMGEDSAETAGAGRGPGTPSARPAWTARVWPL